MRRLGIGIVLLAACLVVATPAYGQRRTSRSMIGLSAGATLTDLQGGVVNTSSRWGFAGGLFGTYRTSRNSMVGLQVEYVQKGGKDLARLDYIEIPFVAGVIIPTDNDRINFNFYTGISLGFKVSCSIEEGVALFACGNAKSTEWAWPIGLGMAIRSENGNLVGLDARYSVAITDAFSNSIAHHRSWQFRLYYGFAVGR